MYVGIPDSVAVGKHAFKFLVGPKVERKHDAAVHHPGTVTVVVRLAVAAGIPYCVYILHAEVEVVGIVGRIYGVRVDDRIFVFAAECRSDVAGYALADKVIVSPVGEGVVGYALIVGVGVLGKLGVHGAVAARLAVGVHVVVLGVQATVYSGYSLALGVHESLRLLHTLVGNGECAQCGGGAECERCRVYCR